MPRLTKCQKKLRKACEAKSIRQNISINDDSNNDNSDNDDGNLKSLDVDDNNPVYDEPMENDNAQQCEAAKGTLTLHTFWDTKKSTTSSDERSDSDEQSSSDERSDDEIEDCNWYNKIPAALENLELDIKKENMKSEVWVRLNGICLYLQLIKCNYSKMNASDVVSNAAGKGVYHSKCIHSWAHEYVMSHQIPYSRRGHHAKTWSFLWDEDILLQVNSYVREHKWDITPQMLMMQMNEVILPGLGFAPSPTIHINTARNYLKELGYTYAKVKKGIYIDGHEREDVVAYRKIFLEQMNEFEHRMPIFSGDDLEEVTWPDKQPLRKKGNGRAIHVSEFLTDVCGRLALPNEMQVSNDFSREACVIMHPGKNNDGWWKADDLVNQVVERAIPIFEACFPGCQALFAFDNASSHSTFSPDALIAKSMNLNPGGKQPKMRRTYFGDERIQQDIVFSSDYHNPNLREQPKGLKQVLIERGLWPNEGLKLEEARKLMSQQPDFLAQKGRLEEIIVAAGHKVIFYPKFHCELNYIENFWGAAKKFSQSNCDYSWTGLQRTVPLALASVPLTTIRRYARKAFRYMDVYRKGLTGKAAEFLLKNTVHIAVFLTQFYNQLTFSNKLE
ncbi:hypothetical protein C1645_840337 [Glomus cerebriforme]|uniref:Tc1-like transposase DDE domain-containing protein n=1 Tax=Glomus cerebriforme TaxID=658196 RepID=A0A397S6H6_9GLOM|nr:hypothetical protein C1645_840337 [Glomus cerebriforme]